MKKLISILLLAAMLCLGLPASLAEEQPRVLELDSPGITFTFPDSMLNTKGILQGQDAGELATGSGIYYGTLLYLPRTAGEVREIMTALEAIDPDDPAALEDAANMQAYTAYMNLMQSVVPVCYFITTSGGEALETAGGGFLADTLSSYEICPVGSLGEYSAWVFVPKKGSDTDPIDFIPEAYRQEYEALTADPAALAANTVLRDPVIPESGESGESLIIEVKDLDGNPVDLAEIYAQHDVTMVNCWATYCNPCIQEFPDLERLSQEMADKNCAIIGICTDIARGNTETAKQILAKTGVTYLNLYATGSALASLQLSAFPTSFFVNSKGIIVTEPVVGAYLQGYRTMFDRALQAK